MKNGINEINGLIVQVVETFLNCIFVLMKFFVPPFTDESIKKQFRELSKKLHPDKNGDSILFIEMQNEKNNLIDAINKHIPTPKKKKVVKKSKKIKHIHIIVDGNEIINKFLKQLKKWN